MRLLVIIFLITIGLWVSPTNTACKPMDYFDKDFFIDSFYKSDFDSLIQQNNNDLQDFKRLRLYLNKKTTLKESIEQHIEYYENSSYYSEGVEENIAQLKQIADNNSKDSLYINSAIYNRYSYGYGASYSKYDSSGSYMYVSKQELKNKIKEKEKLLLEVQQDEKIVANMRKSLTNIEKDIYDCQLQIDSRLAPELQQQKFKSDISLMFILLIGFILLCFFIIIYKRSKEDFAKELLSEYGLQFVTIFVLIIAIVLFGTLGLIDGANLTSILSGIAGFILGKGKGTIMTAGTGNTTNGTNTSTTQPDPNNPQGPATPPMPTITVKTG